MEVRRSINTKIWDDIWFAELKQEEKLLWLYLLTNSFTNMLGIYEISERKIVFDTGLQLKDIKEGFKRFNEDKKAKYSSGYVILFNWIKNQSYNRNMVVSAINIFKELPPNIKISVNERLRSELGRMLLTLSKGKETLSKDMEILLKNEEEKEDEIIEGEGESNPVSVEMNKHNEIFRKLWKNKHWIEQMSMKYKTDIESTRNHLNKFRENLSLKGEYKESQKDAQSHFINWIEKGNSIPKPSEKIGSSFTGF